MHPPALLKEASLFLPQESMQKLTKAYELAQQSYGEEKHLCGEKRMVFVEKVASLLLSLHPDEVTLGAALLQFIHDKAQYADVEKIFGKRLTRIITHLSVVEKGCGRASSLSSAALRKMILVLSEDISVLLVCLHNRWHLLEMSSQMPEKQRTTIAREALNVFAPISARLGMYSLKYALETLAFSILLPDEAVTIGRSLEQVRRKQRTFLSDSTRMLKGSLGSQRKHVEIIGREKHPYSIYRKMQRKGLTKVTDLYDLFGLRILVDSEEDCYQILGLVHRAYHPMIHRMKDYIAFPKPNGYRSLHTTVLGLSMHETVTPTEIQIRTHEMDKEAEFGIAAHWQYKEGVREEPQQYRAWQDRLQNITLLTDTTSGEEMSDSLNEVLLDHIYVLTPKGDPIELPKGSTPLDFAFRVHTEIGLGYRSARVNDVIAPIDQVLENGDMVEVIRQKDPCPSEQWIHLVRTKDARMKLRAFFRSRKQGLYARCLRLPTNNALYLDTHGKRGEVPSLEKRSRKRGREMRQTILLDADTILPHRFAKCCHPEKVNPHPAVIGFITRAGIITIHTEHCHMLKEANPSRYVGARWQAVQEKAKRQ